MDTKEYHRTYNRERYRKRMARAKKYLGGSCKRCGVTEGLQLDHIDPSSKSFGDWMNVSLADFWNEVDKCQLLCGKCHGDKTLEDLGRTSAKDRHGTVSTYRWCGPPKCDLCKKAKAQNQAKNRKLTPRKH